MKKFTTLSMGLLLLVVGCLVLPGCSDSGASPVLSTQALAMFATPNAQSPSATDLASAVVSPTNPTANPATAKLGQMNFVAPSGYQLTVPTNSTIGFSSNLTGTLPIQPDPNGNGNLVTTGIAVLPNGLVTMSFPTVTLVPIGRTRANNLTLTLSGMQIAFTVTNGNWTLPSSTNLVMNRLTDGYYTINGTVATAVWSASTPSGCTLSGLQLYQSGNLVGTLSTKEIYPNGNTITITGNSTVPFDTMSNAVFTFK